MDYLGKKETEVKEHIKQEKVKERLRVKWDRWLSTDKGKGKEKEQKEKSSMMQTVIRSSRAAVPQRRGCLAAVQTMHLCLPTLRARRRFQGEKGHSSLQARLCPGPRCSRNPSSCSELSERSSRLGLQHCCLCALRGTPG